ncbi:MAG TPA: hypothetical protein VGN39_07740, partial [Terriglobales bacterium]|nr:hypothetical protein [Terriglobales bacterium]
HRGLRVGNHAAHDLLPSPPAKRTYHVLSQPDISCATDTTYPTSLDILLSLVANFVPGLTQPKAAPQA